MRYARNQKAATSNGHFDSERKRQEEINAGLMTVMQGQRESLPACGANLAN